MADDDLFREPDENSGPAILGREPILAPRKRKEMLMRARQMKEEVLGEDR